MSGETMNPDKALNPDEAISPEEEFQWKLDVRIVEALETRHHPPIPPDFAARVTGQIPARRPVRLRNALLRPTHYGHWTMVASLVVLAVAFVAMAFNNFGRTAAGQIMEWVFYAQLVTLAVWLGIRRMGVR